MILQNLIFPECVDDRKGKLYLHAPAGTSKMQECGVYMAPGSEVDFLTYFNSFSVDKWKQYSTVTEVRASLWVSGDCEVYLMEAMLAGEEKMIHTRCVDSMEVATAEKTLCTFDVDLVDVEGIIYISVKAREDTIIYGGTYETRGHVGIRSINLAIGICTFRREEYVTRTLDTLKKAFITDKTSPLYEHLQVYVSDNGQTLSATELSTDGIHVMPNKNAGGSGGFGRCMLEAVQDREKYGLTHILLMDDDIVLEPESIARTYALLSTLKESRVKDMLGGGLLRLDIPYIQHASGETWQGGHIGFTKRGYDLRKPTDLLKNEEDLPMEYNGWWYCVVPLVDGFRGFPLPVFVHGDDIEYGLRFHGDIMTLNGIGVWHDAFDNRKASSMEYYDMRNTLIACAIHHPEYSCTHMVKGIIRHMVGQMLHYREEDQRLTMKGVYDFCKGVDFLKETDPAAYHMEIMKMGYKMEDVSEVLQKLGVDVEAAKPDPEHLYPMEGFKKGHLLSINGWLLPTRAKLVALPMGKHPDHLYRCKKALLYDPDTKKGFYVELRRKNLFITLGRIIKMWWLMIKNYKKIVRDYNQHGDELITPAFWKHYIK